MKTALVFVFLVGAALAKPGPEDHHEVIPILKSESDSSPDGGYSFSFETGNEIKRDEVGEVRNAGQEDEFVAVHGSYSYTDPEGNLIEVTYTADENGFHAVGKHIHPSVGSPSAGRSGKSLDTPAAAGHGYSNKKSKVESAANEEEAPAAAERVERSVGTELAQHGGGGGGHGRPRIERSVDTEFAQHGGEHGKPRVEISVDTEFAQHGGGGGGHGRPRIERSVDNEFAQHGGGGGDHGGDHGKPRVSVELLRRVARSLRTAFKHPKA